MTDQSSLVQWTSRTQRIVHRYMDGFRRSDHDAILDCLTDDVVWTIHGFRTTRGKAEFDTEIENPAFEVIAQVDSYVIPLP